MEGLTLTFLSTCPLDKEVTENVIVLMQENTLQNKIHYYFNTIITYNQTYYATLSLLAT